MLLQAAAQTIPALVLVAWLAIAPLTSRLGAAVQALAIAAVLAALSLVGLWVLPPFWTPWVLWLLYALAIARLWHHARTLRPAWPWALAKGRANEWASLAVLVVVGGGAMALAGDAWRARSPDPEIPVVDLAAPFSDGRYIVGHGGSRPILNPHLAALDPANEALRPYRGQAYALDILAIDRFGRRARGLAPSELAAYQIHGREVVAPCPGEVRHVEAHHPDQPIGSTDRTQPAGNHIRLACAAEVEIVLAHLAPGSLRVEAGDSVRAGEPLGAVGNSGNTTEPHLHIHAQRPGPADTPLAGDPLQITIDGRYLVRNESVVTSSTP